MRANPKGGRGLKPNHFPLHQDKDGNFGYLIGYREDGDKVLIPLALAEQIANALGDRTSAFKTMANRLKPRLPFKEWLYIRLFGKQTYREMQEFYEEE